MDQAIQILNKNIDDSNQNINIYLAEIKEKMSIEKYIEFKKKLENIDKIIIFDKNIDKNIKNLVYNIIKSFMIQQKRIEIGDNISVEFAGIAEKYKNDLRHLKKYVLNMTSIMKEHKIEMPEIKPICIETSVSSPSSIQKRLELVKLSTEEDGDINDFINNLPKGKSTQISNDLLKQAAKNHNIDIRIRKDEVNKIIKN